MNAERSETHWAIAAMADVVVERGSAIVLQNVAAQVPEAHAADFAKALDEVAAELCFREREELAWEVIQIRKALR